MNKKALAFTVIAATAISLGVIFVLSHTGDTNGYVISSGKNFKVYDITKDGQSEYRYEVYNKNGKTVKDETVQRVNPTITYISNNTLLSISIGTGTGTCLAQYYDVNRDLFSEVFESPALAAYGNVVYMTFSDGLFRLVIRDIYDESKYHEEFELDISPVANPADALINAEFLDEDVLLISYLSGAGYDEQTTILQLN